MRNYNKNTEELLSEIKEDKNIKKYLESNQKEFVVPLNEYLESLLAEKNLTK